MHINTTGIYIYNNPNIYPMGVVYNSYLEKLHIHWSTFYYLE